MFSVNHSYSPRRDGVPASNARLLPTGGPEKYWLGGCRLGAPGAQTPFCGFAGCFGGVDVGADPADEGGFAFREGGRDRVAQRHGGVRRPNRRNEVAVTGRTPDPVPAVVCLPYGHTIVWHT